MAKTKSNSDKQKPTAAKASAGGNKNKHSKPSTKPQPSSKEGPPKKDIIYRYVCEQHLMGITDVSKMDAALEAGFKNIRSEGFSKPLKELVVEGLFQKGSNKDSICLTQEGIDNMPKDLDQNPDPSAINDRYIGFLEKKVKMGQDKIRKLWEILSDGKAHAINDIATHLGYKNSRSFGNTKVIACMKEMGLIEAEGKGFVKFTKKIRLPTSS